MSPLERFVAARNGQLMTDVLLKGGMGAAFTLATFGGLWWITFLVVGAGFGFAGAATTAALITAVYVAASVWSALRGVDPLANLAPLTTRERARREVEDAVRDVVGGGLERVLRRDAIAGLGGCLIAGPASLVGAWQAWRRRLQLDPTTLAEAEAVLSAADDRAGAGVADRERGALALVHLGLVRLEPSATGEVVARLTARGKQL